MFKGLKVNVVQRRNWRDCTSCKCGKCGLPKKQRSGREDIDVARMFWGITLEHGKVYSQIVEMPFHISMAALGFTNITSEATTIMVESDKADYALCTLQAGKIPQQALDLNFTEGEEVKFFLEGNGGDVHLTGYLLETPREYEYDEEDDEDIDALLTSEDEEASSMESDQGEEEKNDSEEEEEVEGVKSEVGVDLDAALDEKEGNGEDVEEDKSGESDSDEDGSDLEESLSWQAALAVDLDDDEEDSDGGDWKPAKKTSPKKVATKKNIVQKKAGGKAQQKPLSQTLVNLMDMDDGDDSSDTDKDWAPASDDANVVNGALSESRDSDLDEEDTS